MKLAFVIHRYGPDFAGGSEAHCRLIAERLVPDHDITVLTSCARDYVTWADAYPPGETRVNGIRVLRFPVAHPRDLKAFADVSDEVFGGEAPPERQEAWFRANGPAVPGLLDHLRARGSDYDLVLFWAYRYYPSYFGLPLVAERAVLVPTAEEDPAIELDVLQDYFPRAQGFLFLTPEEEALVSTRAAMPLKPAATIGIGLEPAARADRTLLDRARIPHEFLLYLGRVDRNKGCVTLFEYFQAHAAERTGTTLVLAGPATIPIPDHPGIRALGYVSDDMREALLSHARAIVIPSPYESLSIVLLEAWNHGIPALVNGNCKVLQGQVRRANGGLYYRSALEFLAGVDYLLDHPDDALAFGRQGLAYVEEQYRWPAVIGKVEGLLREVVASVRTSPARPPA